MVINIINYIKFFFFKIKFIIFNEKLFNNFNNDNKKNKILVELYTYLPSIISFSILSNLLAKKHDAKIFSYTTRERSKLGQLLYYLFNFFIFRIYRSFGANKHVYPNSENYNGKIYNSVVKKVKSEKDLLKLKIKNIFIGDLFYDEYLRRYNTGYIDINNENFLHFLREAVANFLFWNSRLDQSVKSLIISHSVYLTGLPGRIAVHKNIPVYNISLNSVYYLSKKHYTKFSGFEDYPFIFKKIKKKLKKNILKEARKKILNKFLGKLDLTQIGSTIKHIDANNIFRNNSNLNKIKVDKNKNNILIASHCFSDAVHSHGTGIFLNFYEWIEFLIKYSQKKNYVWYVKMHPAEFDRNKKILDNLLSRHDNFIILPKNTSHNQIISAKIDVVLTVYGTVGYEYPFLDVPVINASSNGPHQAYGFNHHSKSKKEYLKLLDNIPKIKKNKINMKHKLQICEYYFVKFMSQYHFINNLDKIMIKLKQNYNTPMIFKEYIDQFNKKEFNVKENELSKFILSKKNRIYADNSTKKSKVVLFY